uniref:Uncharacterized protein n=1 Tax=Biomphalaria glabrata TaxID=6526 RepID=I3VFR2_BIOGL|nr:unknown [Biomphalaria glabrata]
MVSVGIEYKILLMTKLFQASTPWAILFFRLQNKRTNKNVNHLVRIGQNPNVFFIRLQLF